MKHIILLSDGTGNSSAKLFKTNVWRMYQSLDLDPASAGVRQIACYNDGVGTSAFKPLALLGGMFGYGLKRNVLHLYSFLCQNWEPEDEISIFGFSRGAFTARIVAGLIAREGLLLGQDSRTLAHAIRDIYRHYRFAGDVVISTPVIVRLARPIRHIFLRAWRLLMRQTEYEQLDRTKVQVIAFLGVWDTVAAYGTPLAELTRGIDKWVFPLSMPDRLLHPKVRVARHALALDDERDTFHPLLWDELNSAQPYRIKQIWFAGMHSDVGGGYPDDGLSFRSLAWMMDEAASAGLRFLPGARERFAPPPNRSAPLHDSRKGVAGYYRYQPRKLSAYLVPDDPETVIMRDPSPKARAHLTRVLLHQSAIDRIVSSEDRYSPDWHHRPASTLYKITGRWLRTRRPPRRATCASPVKSEYGTRSGANGSITSRWCWCRSRWDVCHSSKPALNMVPVRRFTARCRRLFEVSAPFCRVFCNTGRMYSRPTLASRSCFCVSSCLYYYGDPASNNAFTTRCGLCGRPCGAVQSRQLRWGVASFITCERPVFILASLAGSSGSCFPPDWPLRPGGNHCGYCCSGFRTCGSTGYRGRRVNRLNLWANWPYQGRPLRNQYAMLG